MNLNKIKNKSKLLAWFFLLVFICSLQEAMVSAAQVGLDEENTKFSSRLVDEADLLSVEEEGKLIKYLDNVSERYEQDIVIVTTNTLGGKTSSAYADDFFDYNDYGFNSSRDGILFLLSMEFRDWAISTSGKSIQVFTDAGMDYMAEQFLPMLSDGDYFKAFEKFVSLSDQFMAQAENDKPYDYNNLPKGLLKWYWLPITLGVAIVIAYLVVSKMKSKMISVTRRTTANDYILADSLKLDVQKDLYLYRNLTQIRIPKSTSSLSSSSRGGSSTHGSSSGGSHGGRSGKF